MTRRIKKLEPKIIKLYTEDKKSLREIEKLLGINKKTVKSVLDKNQIQTRHGGQDILGFCFGRLKVIACVGKDKFHKYIWECECECGNKTRARANDLKQGKIISCGCAHKESSSRNIQKAIQHIKKNGHPAFNGFGDLSGSYYSQLKYNAIRRGLHFSVSKEFLWNLFLKQNKLCAISGMPIVMKKRKEAQTASLDRIDSSKGYTEDNIHWTHKDINLMKQRFSLEQFINYCKLITKNNYD